MTSTISKTRTSQSGPGGGLDRSATRCGGLLTPAEVAALYRVDPRTVSRWAKAGRLDCIRTLGGHRRYPAAQFQTLLATGTGTRS